MSKFVSATDAAKWEMLRMMVVDFDPGTEVPGDVLVARGVEAAHADGHPCSVRNAGNALGSLVRDGYLSGKHRVSSRPGQGYRSRKWYLDPGKVDLVDDMLDRLMNPVMDEQRRSDLASGQGTVFDTVNAGVWRQIKLAAQSGEITIRVTAVNPADFGPSPVDKADEYRKAQVFRATEIMLSLGVDPAKLDADDPIESVTSVGLKASYYPADVWADAIRAYRRTGLDG